MKLKRLTILFVGALAMASCSHDEYSGTEHEGSRLTVIGTINGNATRAGNASWEVGDAIGVSSNNGHDNMHFLTPNGDGVFESSTPAYILGSMELSLTSYYPHHESVSAETPELAFDEPQDFLYATAKATRENPVANFIFNHVMTKVSLTITDENAPEDAKGTVRIEGVSASGVFHTLTGEVTCSPVKTNVTKEFEPNATVEFILPPGAGGSDSHTVLINYQDKVYGGTISLTDLNAGTEYHFSTEISSATEAGQLAISSATISDWNKTEGGNINMVERDPEREDNLVIEPGDFLLSDGSTIDKDDASVSKYKSRVIGIVYYAGTENLENFGYTVTNGLAISLRDAGQSRWGSGSSDYGAWGKEGDNGHPDHLGDLNTGEMNVGGSGPKTNQIMGYNNTQIFITAQQDLLDDDSKAGNEGKYTHSQDLLDLLEEANKIKVEGASSWYLPNFSEFYEITANLEAINKSLKAVGGDQLVPLPGTFDNSSKNETFTTEGYYWTSTLRGSSNGWVSILDNSDDKRTTLSITRNSNATKGTFRFAVAF